MNYRLATVLAQKAYTDDATETIEINVVDPISQLIIEYEGLNTAGVTGTDHFAKCISKIEIVDGSDVLYSLNGHEAQALAYYHSKVAPQQWLQFMNDNYFAVVFNIPFGRKLWDPQLALDPKKFDNLQLKITIDLDAGGVAPDAGRMTVFASVFDQKAITPIGFLTAKQLISYTLVNSAHEYIDLPKDHDFRKILVRAQRLGVEPTAQIGNIKLSEDNDKRVILDGSWADMLRTFGVDTPQYQEYIIGQGTSTSKNFYCTPTLCIGGSVVTWATATPTYHIFYNGDGGRFQTLGQAARNWIATIIGDCPHGALEIPFGDQQDMDDWFKVADLGSLRLDLTAGSSVGTAQTCQVITQQLRKYA